LLRERRIDQPGVQTPRGFLPAIRTRLVQMQVFVQQFLIRMDPEFCIEAPPQSVLVGVRSGPPGTSQQSSATETITPPDAMFCGVFPLCLLT
jgi:hypothetical protein